MEGDKLTDYSYKLSERYSKINTKYIELIAKQIKYIGRITPSNVFRLEQMAKFNENVKKINDMIMIANGITLKELYEIYDKSGFEEYKKTNHLYMARHIEQPKFENNYFIQSQIGAIRELTKGTFDNLSLTTAMSQSYKDLVDLSVQSVLEGVSDYNSEIRGALEKTVLQGASIQYRSGYRRRLDSAVRMNIIDGVKQVNNAVRVETGKQYGSDGVEISAHALCAEDHIPVQGKQYSNAQFIFINQQLKRHISTCNCKHFIKPIILGISTSTYTDDELEDFKTNSEKSVDINGVTMTKYQASQQMRKIETEIRKQKDLYIAAKNLDDDVLKAKSKKKITSLQLLYKDVSNKAGLSMQPERLFVSGY